MWSVRKAWDHDEDATIATRHGLAARWRATLAPTCISRAGEGAGGSGGASWPKGTNAPRAEMTFEP